MVGHVGVGGANPIRVQSMITCDTMDTEASIAADARTGAVGCEIVRITAPTVKDAANLQHIVRGLARARLRCADRGRHPFQTRSRDGSGEVGREGADQSRQLRRLEEIQDHRIHRRAICGGTGAHSTSGSRRWSSSARNAASRMRIGTNHGSLSDRIMNRYGDTPLGMVESALEFARIARELDYHNFIFSMKSSNPKVMIEAYRLLVARLNEEGAGLELSDPPRRDRSRRRRRWPDQERDRHRLAAARWDRRHDPRFAHRRQHSRDPGRASAGRDLQRGVGQPTDRDREMPSFPSIRFRINDARRRRSSCDGVDNCRRRGNWCASSFARRTSRRSRTRSTGWAITSRRSFTKSRASSKSIRAMTQRSRAESTATTQLVTVQDGVDLPVITAFRLLAAKLRLGATSDSAEGLPADVRIRDAEFLPTLC